MRIQYSKQAMKYLGRMPKGQAGTLYRELERVAKDLDGYAGDLKKMAGSSYYRLRVGGYRAILDICRGELVLLVLKVGSRGDVYK